jgi:hypothetical protein
VAGRLSRAHSILLLLLALALVFFLSLANLQLASDDLAWLQGRPPTVFDQYRVVPRLFFVTLHALFGPSAVAALGMIWLFHALNGLLAYRLGRAWLGDEVGALAVAAVVLINPVTLNTLTWISCFSYVQGTTLALLALLAGWRAVGARGRRRAGWAAAALACYGAGLLASHEILFLPVLFALAGWLGGARRLGALLLALGLGLGLAVNWLVYDFGRYGVDAARLFSLDFALAYASSGLSAGLALALAYPLSFLAPVLDFLQLSFAGPVRWGLTGLLLAAAPLLYRRDRAWRLDLSLALAFLALITPYVIRLYLTPESVNYHISYALSGRVFYLAFVAVALGLGRAVSALARRLARWRYGRLALALPLAAYLHALWLYDRADFLGLSVVHGAAAPAPPRWNPYAGPQPWLWPLLAAAAAALATGLAAVRGRPPAD